MGELKAKSRARVIEAKVSIQDSIEWNCMSGFRV